MKLQINTTDKTIKIDSDVLLSVLFDTLEKLFPDEVWEEFTLKTSSTIVGWINLLAVPWTRPYWPVESSRRWWEDRPWYEVTDGGSSDEPEITLTAGTFNVEC